eukprot:CAMPEP_0171666146 /NCGR_PEP_ID=MMETSP0990-20121206/47920_1 /TAXON_ID=483369 /ORGANISM="non described non described, Strain CCMP2098" /LENGTH=52 /DNA_ID=CAMNT_0012249589 /DNA_START=52 /DNA_END=206 /DNA_ORIENTATION=+
MVVVVPKRLESWYVSGSHLCEGTCATMRSTCLFTAESPTLSNHILITLKVVL